MTMAEVEKNNNRISTSTIDIIDVDSPAIAASFSKKKDIVENYFTKPTTVRIVEENRHSYNEDDSPTATRFRTASKTQHPLSLPTDDHVDTTSDVETPTVDTPIDDLLLTPDQNPQAENSEYVRNFFQLPETEHLLEEFICAYYQTNFPNQGRMSIFSNFVCFASNIFGYKIELVIPFSDIKQLEKRTTAYIVPNALEIITHDDAKHFFGSFVFRDQTYGILYDLWQMYQKNKNKMDESSRMQTTDESTHAQQSAASGDSASVMSGGDDDDDDDDDDDSSDEEDESEYESSSDEDEPITQIDPSQTHSSPPKNTIPIAEAKGESVNDKKEVPKKSEGSSSGGKDTNSDKNDNNDSKNNMPSDSGDGDKDDDHHHRPTGENVNETGDNEESEEQDKYIVSENITEISQVPPTSIFASTTKYKEIEVFNETLPASPEDVFWVLFSDNCKLERDHHDSRGDTDLTLTPWEPAPEGDVGMYREMNFISLVNNSLGPKTTRVRMTQRMVIFKGKSCYFVQNSFVSLDVMYSDTFRIQCHLIVTDNGNGTSQLVVTTGIVFVRSSMFKWKIEEVASKEASASYQMWASQARDAVIEAKAKGKLHSSQKGGKKKKKHTKKGKGKKKPTHVRTSSIQKNIPPVATKIVTTTPFDSIGTPGFETTASLPMQAIGYLLGMASKTFEKIHVPVWSVILFAFLFFIYILPQQGTVFQSLEKMDKNLRYYRMQNVMFEKQMNHILYNLTTDSTSLPPEQAEQKRAEIRDSISKWLTQRTKIYDVGHGGAILRDVLYKLNDMRKEATTAQTEQKPEDIYQSILHQDVIQRQTQQRQLDMIIWSIIALVIVSVVRIGLSLFGILK